MLQVGSKAPDFTLEGVLPDGNFKQISLTDYHGKWLVLFFYPLDFTFVCPTEITGFSKRLAEFKELGADIIGASVDSVYSHLAWVNSSLGKISYPLLSDTTHQVARDYGVLLEDKGHTLRGTFIIDPHGVIRYHLVHDKAIGRSVEETLRVLKALQSGDLCPIEWSPGEKTLGKA
jgi:peroxiredoxin (alkyl hydroperoxide reductase subunit C)